MAINEALYSSRSEEWETPSYIFDPLEAEFHFTLDAAASELNHKCEKYISREQNALNPNCDWVAQAGFGRTVWLNPPYGRNIGAWMAKAKRTAQLGCPVVCLVHARTDTKWFHSYCYNQSDVCVEMRFIKGRVKFMRDGASSRSMSAPFPSVLIIFRSPLYTEAS